MLQGRTIHTGLIYCTAVFAAAFVMAVLRTALVAPLAGGLVAVALEAPVMLAVAWTACGWVTERLEVTPPFVDRLVMGGVALLAVLVAEAAVAMLAHPRTLDEFFRSDGRSAVLLGLLAQLAFAFFPLLHRRSGG